MPELIFELEASSEWAWVWQSSWCHLRKCSLFLIFGSPVCTTLILTITVEMGDELGCNNIQKHGEQTVPQNYLCDEDKGVREETIFLIFRWNIVLHDSYQADKIVIEIEEWKQKVPGVCVKSCSRVILSVLRHHLHLKETVLYES